jgi:streptogramin lyase
MTTPRKFKFAVIVALVSAATATGAAASSTATAKVQVTKIHLRGNPADPGSVLSAYGSIWVASHVGTGLFRIDPRTNHVLKVINVGENQCVDLIAGGGKIWDWNCSGETGRGIVYEIDPRKNKVIGHFPKMYGTFGDGSLWAQSQDWTHLLRIDPKSHVKLASIKLPIPLPATGHVFPAAVCGGSVWSIADTSVVRYSTATNAVDQVISLPKAKSASEVSGGWFDSNYAACAGGKVWIPNLAGLYSINMRTNKASRLRVPIHANSALGDPGVTASHGQVFVRTSDTTITQVDARSGKVVRTYPAGGGGGEQIAVGYGSVWSPAFTDSAVWRERIP